MAVGGRGGLFLLWIAFTAFWIGWSSWRSNWSGLDVFVPTTREECETGFGRSRFDDLFRRGEVEECIKRGTVETAMRKSYKLDRLAFIFAPPVGILVSGVVIWFVIWLTIRGIHRQTR
jgi:amino acid transporter